MLNGKKWGRRFSGRFLAVLLVQSLLASATAPARATYNPAGLVFLESQTASNSATISFTGLSATYKVYKIVLINVRPVNDAVELYMEVGTGGGPTWQAGTGYAWVANCAMDTPLADIDANDTDDHFELTAGSLGNDAGYTYSATLSLYDPGDTANYQNYSGEASYFDAGNDAFTCSLGGTWEANTAVTAIRFSMETGNISVGQFRLYGQR